MSLKGMSVFGYHKRPYLMKAYDEMCDLVSSGSEIDILIIVIEKWQIKITKTGV